MLRAIKMSGMIYAIEVTLEDDIENIEQFVSEGNPVVLANELEEIAGLFNVSEDEIKIVEPD